MGLPRSCCQLLAAIALFSVALSETIVVPAVSWSPLDKDDTTIVSAFRQEMIHSNVGNIKCSRYCVERATTGQEAFLRVIWSVGDDNVKTMKNEMGSFESSDKDFTEISKGKSIENDASRNSRCTFSIMDQCEIPTRLENKAEENFVKSLELNVESFDDASFDFSNERLVDKSVLANRAEIGFVVQPHQAEVNFVILGNVTEKNLRIELIVPHVSEHEPSSSLGTTPLFMLAKTIDQQRMPEGLKVKVRYPPPGGWRLFLNEQGVDDKKYRVVVFSDSSNKRGVKKDAGISARQMKLDQMDGELMIYDDDTSDNTNVQKPFQFPDMKFNASTRLGVGEIEDRILTDRSLSDNTISGLGAIEHPIRKYLTVELDPSSNLVALPSTWHRLSFDLTNNHIIPIVHQLDVQAQRPIRIPPTGRWPLNQVVIYPGQTASMVIEVLTPPADSTRLELTVLVTGIVRVKKSVELFVRASGNKIYDDTKPYLNYYFNNNCNGRMSAERCSKSYWSIDVTVHDTDSGLKSVTSEPNGIYPYTDYLSGVSSPVYFHYSTTCCNRYVRVSAMDLSGNVYTQEIDVGVWYNLSGGEITAIVFGVLLLILLIALIVISVIYCRQKQSHDLPYSQRYGSRATSPRTPSE